VTTLKDIVTEMTKLGYPSFAVYGEGDNIAAIVFAESEDALRITMARPEKWDIVRRKS